MESCHESVGDMCVRIVSIIAVSLALIAANALGQPTNLPGQKKWDISITLIAGPVLGTNGLMYGVSQAGDLHTWDASTGEPRWETSLAGFAFGYYGPLVVGPEGHVYANTLTGLHAVDGDTGRLLWTAEGGMVAVGGDGKVFLVREEKVRALDSNTGVTLWEWGAQVSGIPALAANGVLFAVGSRGRVIGLDTRRGEPVWISEEHLVDFASVIVGSDGTVFATGGQGQLFAFDGVTGKKLWEFHAEGQIGSVVIAPNGDIWLGLYYGAVQVLDSVTGQLQRDLMLPFSSRSGLTLTADGTLYVVGGIGSTLLHALNSTTGETNWVFELPSYGVEGLIVGPDGTVYFYLYALSTGLFAVRGTSGLADSAWPTGLQNPQNSSYWRVSGTPQITKQPASHWAAVGATTSFHFHSPVMRPLRIQWLFNGQPIPNATNESLRIENVRFADAGNYSVTLSNQFGGAVSGEATLSVGYAIEVTTRGPGIVQRTPTLDVYPTNAVVEVRAVAQTNRNFLGWSGDATGAVQTLTFTLNRNYLLTAHFEYQPGDVKWRPPVIDADVALSADGRILYGHERYVYVAIDTVTGRRIWEQHSNGEAYSPPAIGRDGTIYIGSYGSTMNALDGQTGEVKWRFNVGDCVHSCPAVGIDGTLYFSGIKLYAVDPVTGKEKWSVNGDASHPAVSADGVVFASIAEKMSAFNRMTGAKLWEFGAGGSSAAIGSDGTVYFGATDGNVYALNGSTGSNRWEFATESPISSSPVIGANGYVYIVSSNAKVYALNAQTGAKEWDFQAEGRVLSKSPALAADGTLYVVSGLCDGHCAKLYALDGSNGEYLWEFYANDGGISADPFAAPNIGPDGTVYFGSYALHGTSPLARSPWPKFQGHADNRGRIHARPLLDSTRSHFTTNGFTLTAHAEPGDTVTVEWTSDWLNWTLLGTFTNDTIPLVLVDTNAATLPKRFYRTRQ
jgi:eukaryotic-like serine/threonine-protein kinase